MLTKTRDFDANIHSKNICSERNLFHVLTSKLTVLFKLRMI